MVFAEGDDMSGGLKAGMVAVLGVPLDENSSFMRGPARAPEKIREALHSDSWSYCSEDGQDLEGDARWKEVGDLDLSGSEPAFEKTESAAESLLARQVRVLTLGGDHSITYPILRAYARHYQELNVLHLDAHSDLYDELDGNRFSHATPLLRSLEENLMSRLVQVGVRNITPPERERAERHGVEVIEMRQWQPGLQIRLDGPLYLTLDMDCLDPAFAPGVSHHEPGGLSTREVLGIIQGLEVPLVGADIVEYNPDRDPLGITAMAAAKFLKEIIAVMLR